MNQFENLITLYKTFGTVYMHDLELAQSDFHSILKSKLFEYLDKADEYSGMYINTNKAFEYKHKAQAIEDVMRMCGWLPENEREEF